MTNFLVEKSKGGAQLETIRYLIIDEKSIWAQL